MEVDFFMFFFLGGMKLIEVEIYYYRCVKIYLNMMKTISTSTEADSGFQFHGPK